MGKWVESVGVSLGVVEQKAMATKKVIDSVVPQRPSNESQTVSLVADLPDRFSKITDMSKREGEQLFEIYKKFKIK